MTEKTIPPELPVRDAATIILSREGNHGPEVLMGQRGAAAAFMPNKFVFPGGAVDPSDGAAPMLRPLPDPCARRLEDHLRIEGIPHPAQTFAATAIRELWEETGLALGGPGVWSTPPAPDWQAIAARGLVPNAGPLRFVFRAITPPGRPRRFDARFFMADASAINGDPEDFGAAQDELSHLQWIPLSRARSFDLPFITEVVLAEIARLIGNDSPPDSVPFFDNSTTTPMFRRLI
ncbi:MAG: NUDIX hydrolase [Gemmobacter sp.]|nr:NUDIX hydrolase [Gemmobacter sp.]